MDQKIAGLLGAVAALASIGTAQASAPGVPQEVLKAQSYADLLTPIPNASATLEALDRAADTEPNVQLAQFYIGREYHHHHHHHHHHHGYWRDDPRIVVVPRDRYRYRHHHHHHHHNYYRRYRDDD